VSLPLARPRPWPLLAALLALAACSPDGSPTMPPSDPLPTLGRATFQLTIDVASGTVTIAKPSTRVVSGSTDGPSFSLLGDDAIALHASNCTWTDVGKKKRCTFDLALENRLGQTDLMTPTTFPRAPDGVDGILVFPFSSAALGVSGGAATPSPDWDNAPANFFNDFANCSGKSNDCYRYETYPGPLYGGEFSESRTVGFDVDRDAHTVSAYIVVAADLRDNPVQQTTIAADEAFCGAAELNVQLGTLSATGNIPLTVGTDAGKFDNVYRSFCSFPLQQARVVQATLRMSQYEVGQNSYAGGDEIIVDLMDIGFALDGSDFDAPGLQIDIGTLSSDAALGWKELDVTHAVRSIVNSRANAQFRLRYRNDMTVPTEHVRFEGVSDFNGDPMANPPELVLRFTER
jgi:hypothetical protein